MDVGPLDRIKHRHVDLHRSLLSYPTDLSSLPLPAPTPAWLTVLSVRWGRLGLMPLSLQALGGCFPSLRWCFRMPRCQLIKHRMRPSQRLSQGQSLCQPPPQTLHRCSQWDTPLKIIWHQSPCTSPDASGNWASPVDTGLPLWTLDCGWTRIPKVLVLPGHVKMDSTKLLGGLGSIFSMHSWPLPLQSSQHPASPSQSLLMWPRSDRTTQR